MVQLLKSRSSYNIWSRNIFPVSMEGCVLYVPLWQEDMQGSTLLSYDQYHHPSTLVGAPTWGTTGRTHSGVNQGIKVPYHTALQVSNKNFTAAAWFNTTDLTAHRTLFASLPGGTDEQWGMQINNDTHLWASCSADGTFDPGYLALLGSTAVLTSTWYYAELVYIDGVSASIYLSTTSAYGSTAEDSDVWPATNDIISKTNDLYIGVRESLANDFVGIMGESWLWMEAKSLAKRQHNWEVTKWRYM